MKFTPEVIAALNVLRNAAENDFERHRLDVLERDLAATRRNKINDNNRFQSPKIIDLTGQRFGKLTVIARTESKNGRACWLCECDCGNTIVTTGRSLREAKRMSCGCKRDIANKGTRKHGMSNTKIYNTWCGIKDRCFNPNSPHFPNYGGRGIIMFPAWINDFQAFYDYVSQLEHYGENNYSIDRIDNDGNYEPANIRWADRKTQQRNKRNSIEVEYKGEKMNVSDAAEKSGINAEILRTRIRNGDNSEDRIFRPVKLNPVRG